MHCFIKDKKRKIRLNSNDKASYVNLEKVGGRSGQTVAGIMDRLDNWPKNFTSAINLKCDTQYNHAALDE